MSDSEDLRLVLASIKSQSEINEERLKLRLDQIEAKVGKARISPGVIAVIAAIVGVFGAALGSYFQGQSNLSVERLKFESTLILDALKAESQADAAQKLDFLVKARLIDGRGGAITALTKQPGDLPIINLQSRLRELEGEVAVSRCVETGGVFDASALRCIPRVN